MSIGIGIVAHVKRFNAARALREEVGAQVISWDYGCLGAEMNHIGVWEALSGLDTHWSVVLEDDALPVKDFRIELARMLDLAPTPVVSLYLGSGHKYWSPCVERTLRLAHARDAHWLLCRNMIHAVGIAVRTPLVEDMIRYVRACHQPIDERITLWSVNRLGRQAVSYPIPSLVDHADWPTLIAHADGKPRRHRRVAYECGTREQWNTRTLVLGQWN